MVESKVTKHSILDESTTRENTLEALSSPSDSTNTELSLRITTSRDAKANYKAFVAILIAMLGAMMFGLDIGNFGNVQGFTDFRTNWCVDKYGDQNSCGLGSIESCNGASASFTPGICDGILDDVECCHKLFTENDSWNNNFVLWGATLIPIGAAFGGLLVGPFITHWKGRRSCICLGGLVTIAGCLFSSVLSFQVVAVFFIARFFTGFGVGICCFALPMYNSEIATPKIRGRTGSLFQLNVVIGQFLATLLTLFVNNWHFGLMLPAIPGTILTVTIWLVPESPRYIMIKEGFTSGVEELKKIRKGDVSAEATEISEMLELEKQSRKVTYTELFTQSNLRKRLFIAVLLQIAQQFTGVNAFLGYAYTIFDTIGVSDPILFNCIWNGVMLVGVMTGLLLLDNKHGGRRIQLLGATTIMGPPLLVAALAFVLHLPGAVTMIMLCIFGLGFQLAWGIITWLYPSEIFTMFEKDKSISLTVFAQYTTNAVVFIITPHLIGWSISGTLFLFAGTNIFNFLFVYYFIIETRSIPLEQIPALFITKPRRVSRPLSLTL
eukprot:CFRG2567T1